MSTSKDFVTVRLGTTSEYPEAWRVNIGREIYSENKSQDIFESFVGELFDFFVEEVIDFFQIGIF